MFVTAFDPVIREAAVRHRLDPDSAGFRTRLRQQVNRLEVNADANRDGAIEAAEIAAFARQKTEAPFPEVTAAALFGVNETLVPPEPSLPPNPVAALSNHLSVNGSFLDDMLVAKPATFSFSHYGEDDETRDEDADETIYAVRAGVRLNGPRDPLVGDLLGRELSVIPVAGIDANLSTDGKAGQDDLVYRVGVNMLLLDKGLTGVDEFGDSLPPRLAGLTGHHLLATFDYRTDRHHESDVLGATAQHSFNYPGIGLGRAIALSDWLRFNWRPYLGLSYGHVADAGDRQELKEKEDSTDLFFRLPATLRFETPWLPTLGRHVLLQPELRLFEELRGKRISTSGTEQR